MKKLCWLVVLLAGCELPPPTNPTDAGATTDGGAADAGTGSLDGPLAFPVHQSLEVHLLDSQGNELGYAADLVDYDNTCAQLEAGTKPTAFQQVEVGVLGAQSGVTPPPGTYQVVTTQPTSGFGGYVKWARLLPDAGILGPLLAQDGTVTLTAASDDQLTGSFQVDIADLNGQVGQLSGTFDAPYCP